MLLECDADIIDVCNDVRLLVEMVPFGSEVGSNARSAELNAPFGSGFGSGSDFPEPFRTRSNGVRTPNAAASPTCPIYIYIEYIEYYLPYIDV